MHRRVLRFLYFWGWLLSDGNFGHPDLNEPRIKVDDVPRWPIAQGDIEELEKIRFPV
jgi:hypothetical protein